MSNVFRKTGPASALDMFTAEAEGLEAIAATQAIRVPEVYRTGVDGDTAFIEMEKLRLEPTSRATEAALGEQLAAMHESTAERFGWGRFRMSGKCTQTGSFQPIALCSWM